MINTFWFNLRPPNGGPPVPLTIGPAGGSGLLQQVIDLATVYNRGELAGIEVEVKTRSVAPGASKNLTAFYAFCSKDNRTSVQLSQAAASQALALPNAADTIRVYSLPVNYQGAQYLHIWFDCDAMDDGAHIDIELKVTAKVAN